MRVAFGAAWIAQALGLAAPAWAASNAGYRLDAPAPPMPVGLTNAWALENAASVPFMAGGSATDPGNGNYPQSQPPQAHPGYQPEYQLAFSALGQPVEGGKPDLFLGQAIPGPEEVNGWYVDWAAMSAAMSSTNQISPPGSAFYEPSAHQFYVLDGGSITIEWILTDGVKTKTIQNTYLASGAPASRPYRIYWTDKDYANNLGFNAPPVNLSGRYVKFHYNRAIPGPVYGAIPLEGGFGSYTTNVVRGLYVDSASQLHAAPGDTRTAPLRGLTVMQYFTAADLREQVPGGVIAVEVCGPDMEILDAGIGARLLPRNDGRGAEGLAPRITAGLAAPAAVYQHQGQFSHSPKNGWVFPLRATRDAPWEIEVYWEEADPLGTRWPYEVDWYEADWPADAAVYVRGATAGALGADLPIPRSLAPQVMDFQEPAGHALLTADSVYRTTGPGYSLLRFQANDNVWFQAVRAVWNTDPMFDRAPHAWTIGTEIVPRISSAALRFDPPSARVTVTNLPPLRGDLTVEAWVNLEDPDSGVFDEPLFARYAVAGSNPPPERAEFRLFVNAAGRLGLKMGGGDSVTTNCLWLTADAPVGSRTWHHVAFTIAGAKAALYLDGVRRAEGSFNDGARQRGGEVFQIGADGTNSLWGWMDEIRVWDVARSESEIRASRYRFLHDYAEQPHLVAYYPVDMGSGPLEELCHGRVATLEHVTRGLPDTTPLSERDDFCAYAGYIYDPTNRAPYNAGVYHYPTEQDPGARTSIFGVNEGLIEVWWARNVQQAAMPEPLYIPGWAQVYTNLWPAAAPAIVLASGQGSPAFLSEEPPAIYVQNTPGAPGYNPNEEHAVVAQGGGGYVAYALRDDLNADGGSRPFVLVDRTNPDTGRPDMLVFAVVRTNAAYPGFSYTALAGQPLRGPHPLDSFPNLTNTTAVSGPGWRDRTFTWWARAAGKGETGTAAVVMRNWYPMQEGFAFPALAATKWPVLHTPLPWLPVGGNSADPTKGTPVDAVWTIYWPSNVPAMAVGQTLTMPVNGLPAIWNQLSVDVIYQQSTNSGQGDSTVLFDPTVARGVDLPAALAAYGFKTAPYGNISIRQGCTYFHNLPPDLSERFYYDPLQATNKLRFIGQRVAPPSGGEYLLVNRLTAAQRAEIKALCKVTDAARKNEWDTHIDGLATNIVTVKPEEPFDHLALAAVGTGAGYVTLAFNNATNPALGVNPGDPVTLSVIKVEPRLYTGWVVPLKDPVNLLSEQLNVLFSESFAGQADNYEFQWRAQEPATDGTTPANPGAAPLREQGSGLTRLRIGGEGGALTDMVNKFFAVRYRAVDDAVIAVVGTNWSAYTDFNLAEGWVQRVLNAMTPFEQRMRNLYDNPVETQAGMLQQAGGPFEGDIALNMEAAAGAGLIQVYHTIFNTAERLSLELGVNAPAANQQLLLAAGRLNALYMLLGNEAVADALDPTIGFGADAVIDGGVLPLDYGAFASSLFCFQNQVPTLLDEELALLRGRGTPELAPGMTHSPYYNRLVWNFTKGIDAGEVAYAVNYNIQGTDAAIIDENTAARLYPQGHGDAWGHYLGALGIYYRLLRHPCFSWGDPSISPMLLGLRTVDADYLDEERLAETAAALARAGAEIVQRVHCKVSSAAGSAALAGIRDDRADRAWGVGEWAARAGMGAFYNWAVCNSLLPTNGAPRAVEGDLRAVNRSTVAALPALTGQFRALQRAADNADQGFNPLGLARDAVPFDISPAGIDAGKTHFEQVYERAAVALNNAAKSFDAAQEATRLLRRQSAQAENFRAAAEDEEAAFKTQLIEIFGYPYADDIGPSGTYPQGYDGPDLYHYMYADLEALGFDRTTEIGTLAIIERAVTADNADILRKQSVTFHLAENGLLAKPGTWTGARRAQGQVQTAQGEYLSAFLEFRAALKQYENNLNRLNSAQTWYKYTWLDNESKYIEDYEKLGASAASLRGGARLADVLANCLNGVASDKKGAMEALAAGMPTSQIVGLATGGDLTAPVRGALKAAGAAAAGYLQAGIIASKITSGALDAAANTLDGQVVSERVHLDYENNKHTLRAEVEQLAREEQVAAVALMGHLQRVSNAQQAFLAAVARGEDLLAERERCRKQCAQRIAAGRYNDMAFRIFRNDALRRYGDAFQLAGRYTYLAAMAYDYETCLLKSDSRYDAGAGFLDDIVRARTVGRLSGGQPVVGSAGVGEPGLADILARMQANWSVLHGRLGFNNPQNETSRFSLRTELFRIAPGAEGDANWQQQLEQCRVADLFAYEPFRRYCLPFAAQQGLETHEPGLVIEFGSEINFGGNFFGRPLAGGDNAYDSSHFATKIRAVGVWFTGYDRVSSGSQATLLANQPRVYLVPVGLDVMRAPSGDGGSLRAWRILDQAIPLPFTVGSELGSADWIPLFDSVGGELAQARRHGSLRAYHDRGFVESEMTWNSRLIGRSVWNTRWVLIIPAGTLNSDRDAALDAFIYGPAGNNGVSDIKLHFKTYSYQGN